MTTNISLTMKVYIILYEMMYNENIHSLLYKKTCNDIISYYTRLCIMTIFISLIHESVYHIIRDDV